MPLTEQTSGAPEFRRERARHGPVPLPTKIYQGLGAIPPGLKEFAFRAFLLLYYNQVLGLPASQASLALLLALIVDAISDPLVGSFSDNLRHRLGRRHPLMYASILPFSLAIYGLFAPPQWAEAHLFLWLLAFAVSVRLFLTFFSVPWNALFAELSDDYVERSELISYRFVVIWLAGIVFTWSVYAFIFTATDAQPQGQLNGEHYPTFALVLALAVALGGFLATHLTRDQIPFLRQPIGRTQRFDFARFIGDVKLALGNRDFVILLVAVLASAIVSGTGQALEIYVGTFFWGFDGDDLRWMAVSAFGGLLAFIFVRPLQQRFEKKTLLVVLSVAVIVVQAIPVTLFLLGWIPSGSEVAIVVTALTVVVFLGTLGLIMFASMIADTLDAQELRTGARQEGLFNSVISFSSKTTSGAGIVIAGVLIDFFVRLPEGASRAALGEDVILRLGLLDAYLVPVFNLVWLWLVLGYSIDRSKHAAIKAALAARVS